MLTLEEQKIAPAPRTLAELAQSLASLGFSDPTFSLRVTTMAAGQVHKFNGMDLAQLLSSLRGAGEVKRRRATGLSSAQPLYHGGLLREAAPRIARLAPRMNPQTLTTCFLSLAHLGYHDDTAVPALERELLRKAAAAELAPQGLCNAVLAAAKLGRNRSSLFPELAPALT